MAECDDLRYQLTDTLEALRQERGLPSLSMALAVDGDIVWQGACGRATIDAACDLAATEAHATQIGPIAGATGLQQDPEIAILGHWQCP